VAIGRHIETGLQVADGPRRAAVDREVKGRQVQAMRQAVARDLPPIVAAIDVPPFVFRAEPDRLPWQALALAIGVIRRSPL
jgi:hypothetical protein